jgi:hypothetical protein
MRRNDETSPRIETGAMLSRTFDLPSGPRVRLRMAHRSDLPLVFRTQTNLEALAS